MKPTKIAANRMLLTKMSKGTNVFDPRISFQRQLSPKALDICKQSDSKRQVARSLGVESKWNEKVEGRCGGMACVMQDKLSV